MIKKYGYLRVGAIVPSLEVGNVQKNTLEIIEQIKKASLEQVQIVTTPELSLTGYTCSDLFFQDVLLEECILGLKKILESTETLDIISIIGLPIKIKNKLYNCAAVVQKGKILGLVPKSYLPNYNEFYEKRWFESGIGLNEEITLLGQTVPVTTDLLFQDEEDAAYTFAIEICEDLWSSNPPSTRHTASGALVIFNLSASNEIIGKYEFRKNLIASQSARTISSYVYASSGVNESTTDVLFSGSALICEDGSILKENKRFDFASNMIYTDVDIKRLLNNRYRNTTYQNVLDNDHIIVKVSIKDNVTDLVRTYSEYPFVPKNELRRSERCEEIFNIQSCALAKRLKHIGTKKTVIGISGGLDSTLAFLVIVAAYKKLGIDNSNIIAITMPGFGTTDRTYNNAVNLVKEYGATLHEISIKDAVLQHFKDIDHDVNNHDVTYENAQARERTQILMDVANKEGGILIGTGDLSELALGWCTYNGDHMSMYAVNTSIPKTLVRYLVKWIADTTENERQKETIYDILDTPISPELLPPDKNGEIKQKTESTIGPYVLHDFFLYHFLRYGASPSKIRYIANQTFKDAYSEEEISKWLRVFLKRFFSQQFKRSCIPDGVKVGTISLSPRGDLRMPSDASVDTWLNDLDKDQ